MYSSDPKTHDDIVVLEGAFEQLLMGLRQLLWAGASVELRTVLLQANVEHLERLADFVVRHLAWVRVWAIMQLERIGYAKGRWNQLFVDTSTQFSQLEPTLLKSISHGVRARLYNFPLCTVPPEWRHIADSSISDWKRRYLDGCADCGAREACTGFFEWYDESSGFAKVAAL